MVVETFQVSAETIKKKKRERYLYALLIPLFMVGIYLFTPLFLSGKDLSFFLLGFGIVISLIIILTTNYTVNKQLATLSFSLTNETIEYCLNDSKILLAYADITNLTIKQTKSGDIFFIQVQSDANSFAIHNVNNLNTLSEIILDHVPNTTNIQRKIVRLNPNKPTIILFWGTLAFILFAAYFQLFGLKNPNLLSVIGMFLLAGVQLFSKPISSTQGQQYRRKELVLGGVFLFLGFLQLSLFLSVYGTAVLSSPCGLIGKYIKNSGCIQAFDYGESNDGEYVAFLPDNQTLAQNIKKSIPYSPISGWVGFWTPILRHDEDVQHFLISQDSKRLTSFTLNQEGLQLWLWDTINQNLMSKQFVPNGTYFNSNTALSSNGESIAFSVDERENDTIEIWQLLPWRKQLSFPGEGPIALSLDDIFLAGIEEGSYIHIWDIKTGNTITTIDIPESRAHSMRGLTFSPDGQQLAGFDHDSTIFIWQIPTGDLIHTFQEDWGYPAEQLVYSPDGNWLASGYYDFDGKYLTIWNVQSGELQKQTTLGENSRYSPKSFSFTSDGQLLAVGMNDAAFVFEFEKLLQ